MSDKDVEFEGEGEPIELDLSAQPPPKTVRVTRPSVVAAKRKRRWPFVILFLIALGAGGAALEKTPHGAFFRHPIDAFVHAEERALLTRDAIDKAHDALAADTLDRGNEAIAVAEAAVGKAPRHKPLLGWAAYTTFAHELRFGRHNARHDRAVAFLSLSGEHALATAARDLLHNDRVKARAALQKTPRDADALLLLAAIEHADKHPRESLAALEEALRQENSPRTRAALMRALEATDATRATTMARELARDAANHVGARLVLGRLSIASRDLATANKCVAELLPLEKNASRIEQAELETLRALVALEKGDFAGAEHLLDRSQKLSEGLPSLWTLIALGEVSAHSGKPDEARVHYDAALAIDPSNPRALLGRTRAKAGKGK